MRGPDKITVHHNITPFLELKIPDSVRAEGSATAGERVGWAAFLDVSLFAAMPAVRGRANVDKVWHKRAVDIGRGIEGVWAMDGVLQPWKRRGEVRALSDDGPRGIADISSCPPRRGGSVDDDRVVARA
jgi:hypothetical protein